MSPSQDHGDETSPPRICVALGILCALFAFSAKATGIPDTRSAPLAHEAYVWQRAWNNSLRSSLQAHGREFASLVVLAAQVDWKQGVPGVVRVPVDYPRLAQLGRPVGIALRVGSFRGPFGSTNREALFLRELAIDLVRQARSAGISPAEVQVDFDCPESNLAGYLHWLVRLREAVHPVPLTFTALPTWLGRPAFGPLAHAADSYVLQVHSLQRSSGAGPAWQICDPAAARRAVERAATFGRPFRIALPTYGYLTATDSKGRLVGVSAEGPASTWPPGSNVEEVWSDPLVIAELVRDWAQKRPPQVTGIIWYRFPVPEDTLNWRWPTLSAILASRIPSERVRVESRRVEAALVEISVLNEGELDISSRLAINARWQGARLLAADGLRGFALTRREPERARFESPEVFRLRAGDRRVAGWLRLSEESEVRSELERLGK